MHCVVRRGSVVMLAVAAVALLFIIGMTFLVVSHQEREAALQSAEAHDLRAIQDALTQNTMHQLRSDVVGSDHVAYDGK